MEGAEFDEKRTVNSNFQWIREKLVTCDRIAQAKLQDLEDEYSSEDFAADRKTAEVLASTWLKSGSCCGVHIPSTDDTRRDAVATQLLKHIACRQFYALIRGDVGRLADLRDETFAKRFEYWEHPPAELIELLFRAETTVKDVENNIEVLIFRYSNLSHLCDDSLYVVGGGANDDEGGPCFPSLRAKAERLAYLAKQQQKFREAHHSRRTAEVSSLE